MQASCSCVLGFSLIRSAISWSCIRFRAAGKRRAWPPCRDCSARASARSHCAESDELFAVQGFHLVGLYAVRHIPYRHGANLRAAAQHLPELLMAEAHYLGVLFRPRRGISTWSYPSSEASRRSPRPSCVAAHGDRAILLGPLGAQLAFKNDQVAERRLTGLNQNRAGLRIDQIDRSFGERCAEAGLSEVGEARKSAGNLLQRNLFHPNRLNAFAIAAFPLPPEPDP